MPKTAEMQSTQVF